MQLVKIQISLVYFPLCSPAGFLQKIARFLGLYGINTASDISKFTKPSRAGIYPKYAAETVLFPAYTTRQRNFALYVAGVIFTCKYFKFGLKTTGLSQSHFRNLSACSISSILSL